MQWGWTQSCGGLTGSGVGPEVVGERGGSKVRPKAARGGGGSRAGPKAVGGAGWLCGVVRISAYGKTTEADDKLKK